MTREEVISGLQMTMDLFLFDPTTGEILTPDMLNDIDRVTYDACKGAIEALKAQIDTPTNTPTNTLTDTISKQDAIDLADKIIERDTSGNNDVVKAMSAWKECIKGLSSAQQERKTGKWIPCSERLPEEDGCYLVTTTGTNNDIIDIAYYTTGLWHKASRIKAWMPLPEPYMRGEQNE